VRVLSRGEGAIRQRHLKKFGVEPKLGTLRSGTKYLLHVLRCRAHPENAHSTGCLLLEKCYVALPAYLAWGGPPIPTFELSPRNLYLAGCAHYLGC
jgi:hypothetical protein